MLNQSGSMPIKVGNDNISNADKARNLGVTFDKHLNNTDHINNLSSTLFFVSRNHCKSLSLIGPGLNQNNCSGSKYV